MNKTSYILIKFRVPLAVIVAETEAELKRKLKTAIQEEVEAETDGQFELSLPRVGDWGEEVKLTAKYVNDGSFITDEGFTLTKVVSY